MHAAVSNGALRLVDSESTQFGGRLEVYYNNEWGTVCDDGWGSSDAIVACTQMGFVSVSDSDSSLFGFGASSQRIWLDDVACSGSESRLIDCDHAGVGFHNCAGMLELFVMAKVSWDGSRNVTMKNKIIIMHPINLCTLVCVCMHVIVRVGSWVEHHSCGKLFSTKVSIIFYVIYQSKLTDSLGYIALSVLMALGSCYVHTTMRTEESQVHS